MLFRPTRGVEVMDINKNSLKVLRYINKRSGHVSYEKVFTKFSKQVNPPISDTVNWLKHHKFIYIEYSDRDSYGGLINPSAIVITIEGKDMVEERLSRNSSDIFARTIAIIALLLSFASIVVSAMRDKQ
jgi:hypothetical protein